MKRKNKRKLYPYLDMLLSIILVAGSLLQLRMVETVEPPNAILEEYVTGSETENGIVLYFDESYVPCIEADASYLCMVTKQDTALSKIQVDFCDAKATPLYSIEASCYTPLTLASFGEGAGL